MATGVKTRVKLPKTAKAGETITVKTQVTHQMENGLRRNALGLSVPRGIIYRFECSFDGEPVIDVALEPGISTNPFFEFQIQVPRSGVFSFAWHDEDGAIYTAQKEITVT